MASTVARPHAVRAPVIEANAKSVDRAGSASPGDRSTVRQRAPIVEGIREEAEAPSSRRVTREPALR